jgi:hypothetical protein
VRARSLRARLRGPVDAPADGDSRGDQERRRSPHTLKLLVPVRWRLRCGEMIGLEWLGTGAPRRSTRPSGCWTPPRSDGAIEEGTGTEG